MYQNEIRYQMYDCGLFGEVYPPMDVNMATKLGSELDRHSIRLFQARVKAYEQRNGDE